MQYTSENSRDEKKENYQQADTTWLKTRSSLLTYLECVANSAEKLYLDLESERV